MRLSFGVLVFVLLAAVGWALWEDAAPEWKRYQRELVRREIDRLESELELARAQLREPGTRSELDRIDGRLRGVELDSTSAQLPRARARLERVDAEIDEIRRELRAAEKWSREPAATAVHAAVSEQMEEVQRAYAVATGTWPLDRPRIDELWATRDSLAEILDEIDGPAVRLRSRLEERRAEAQELRLDAVRLTGARDSLEAVRSRILEPVTTRESTLARLRDRTVRIREIVSPDGREVARCPTCHGSLEDPPGVHPRLPSHDVFRDVPCTVCHGGRGRALDVEGAHRGLLTAAGSGAGPYSLRARIERLLDEDPADGDAEREELRRITGVDPTPGKLRPRRHEPGFRGCRGVGRMVADGGSVLRADVRAGSRHRREPASRDRHRPVDLLVRGRPLRYVGSRRCLSCHEVQHREHSRRWLATKSRSIERLVDTADPQPCFPCHTTGYDAATGSYAEPGVTCEACHGPGERYDEMMFVGQELLANGEEERGRALLDHASRLAREGVSRRTVSGDAGPVNLCVTCHHPRRHRDGGPGALEKDMGVVPGANDEELAATRE